MKVLDLPDEQDNSIRKILLRQDDKILEELTKKSKQEIQVFLIQENENQALEVAREKNEKLSKLKSSFPQSILDKNPDIASMLEKQEFEILLTTLKDKDRLKAITDQL